MERTRVPKNRQGSAVQIAATHHRERLRLCRAHIGSYLRTGARQVPTLIEIHAKRPDRPSEITKRFAKSRRVFARKLGSDSVSICQCVRENIPLLCEEGNILPKPKLPNFKLSHDKDEFIADDEIASIIVYTSIMPTDLAQISNIL